MKHKGSEYAIAVGIGITIVISTMMVVLYRHHVNSICGAYEYLVNTNYDGLAQAAYAVMSAPKYSKLVIDLPMSLDVALDDNGKITIRAEGMCVKRIKKDEEESKGNTLIGYRYLALPTKKSHAHTKQLCLENYNGVLMIC